MIPMAMVMVTAIEYRREIVDVQSSALWRLVDFEVVGAAEI